MDGAIVTQGSLGRSELSKDLAEIYVSRVLDVATGEGRFVRFLADHLGSFKEMVGVDLLAPSDDVENVFCQERVSFVEMDASKLAFTDGSFDVVSISSSLHHMPSPEDVLGEMRRVLASGGHMIIRETHCDVESEPERTDMILHHWVAKIDRLLDSFHAVTFSRSEVLELIAHMRLHNVRVYDARNIDSHPFDAEALRLTEQTIDKYLRAAERLPHFPSMEEQAQELRRRLREVGIQWEPEVFVVARKP